MILAGIILLSMSMSSIGFRIQWLWQESFKVMNQALGVA
jgi:flagellar biosynthetic protein FliR